MKLWDVIKTVGTGVVREVVPGGGILIDVVNEFLPDEDKLPGDATGEDIDQAVAKLPPEQQAQLLAKEFDVDITRIRQTNETVRAMLEADTKNPHTTRPYIAKGSFHVIAFAVIVVTTTWAYGVIAGKETMVQAVTDGWPFILSVIGPFVVLLHAYFGVLRSEQKNRLDAAAGRSGPAGLAGMLSNLIRRK
jgi:hypothetical protein